MSTHGPLFPIADHDRPGSGSMTIGLDQNRADVGAKEVNRMIEHARLGAGLRDRRWRDRRQDGRPGGRRQTD